MNACCDAVSIVIPVWNEELFLLRLLELLRRHLPSSEIIVADHNSQDRSRQIAGQFGCKIVAGGRPGMARNAGAAVASGTIIVFLDADVVFGASEINKMLAYFSDREVVCVHPRLTPMSDDAYILTCYAVVDLYFRFVRSLNLSQGLGGVIALRKSAFDVVEGFSEELTVGEDADFFRRLRNVGRIVYDENICTFVSARRFSVENRFVFSAKCIVWAVLRFFGSASCPWGYRWVNYPDRVVEQEAVYLSRTERAQ